MCPCGAQLCIPFKIVYINLIPTTNLGKDYVIYIKISLTNNGG